MFTSAGASPEIGKISPGTNVEVSRLIRTFLEISYGQTIYPGSNLPPLQPLCVFARGRLRKCWFRFSFCEAQLLRDSLKWKEARP
jgi:hypothetical protein